MGTDHSLDGFQAAGVGIRDQIIRAPEALSARVTAGGEGGDPRVSAGRERWVFDFRLQPGRSKISMYLLEGPS
jgi:hypothetical protein